MIRIALADDQTLIRGGLRALLDAESDLTVVGEAGTGRDAVALARRERPDVLVMDIRMPDGDGLWATEQITVDPRLTDVRVLVLTTFEQDDHTFRALRAGAAGFLGKGGDVATFCDAVRTVHRGERLLSPTATAALVERFLATPALGQSASLAHLTAREREIVALVGAGLSNDEIAARLVISPLTAKTHVTRAMTKSGCRDRAQLVVLAYESGLVIPRGG
ncbi:response regulator [Microbacterium sp.]|uniref:response regulator n=1 Tax=Microbacterium sp. TaxID=51671 RepID=UPI003A8603FF